MSLAPGTRIGVYEIQSLVGAGGMGEVYRARDTKLGREVAIKTLPDSLAADSERLARFEREARTLATLNHPNIAHVHGFEDSGGTRALVMELVDGEDLSARIARGPVPLDEAMPLARQIADALAAAHDAGIIHRDLKPANIKVRDDGTVKVLDFGLAKAMDPSAGNRPPSPGFGGTGPAGDSLNSPTITTPAMTAAGVVLGTAAYMSPEQAKGRAVDKRADIWAFGCVVYEMLTGRRAFAGEDVSETLASILKTPPDLVDVPVSVRPLIESCLERDPKRRLRDIGDAWRIIDATPGATPAGKRNGVSSLAWGTAVVGLALAAGISVIHFRERPPSPEPVSFQISPPAGNEFDIYLVLSPDGRRVAFTARDERGDVRLWVRDLRTLDVRALPGTEGAWSPFWSPDGRHLAFAVDRQLKRIDTSGGAPQTLCELPHNVGSGNWGVDDVILFGSRGAGSPISADSTLGIYRVSASGGKPIPVTVVNPSRGETFHSFPVFLPDRRHFFFLVGAPVLEDRGVAIGSLELAPDRQNSDRIVNTAFGAAFAASASGPGHLIYIRDGSVVSQAFDPERLTLAGDPAVIVDAVGGSGAFGFFSVAGTRALAYRQGRATNPNESVLTWFDRAGKSLGVVGDRATYGQIAISPDGRHLAVTRSPTGSNVADLWLTDLPRMVNSRFTFNTASDSWPIWSPDGQRVVFQSNRAGHFDLYEKPANAADDEKPLLVSTADKRPTSLSPDGRFLLYDSTGEKTLTDISVLPVDGDRRASPLVQTPFNETQAVFSPDGRWFAYVSNESGRNEIYARPFVVVSGAPAASTGKFQISKDGGTRPRWRGDGKELFFRAAGTGMLMSVSVSARAATLEPQAPTPLFDPRSTFPNWDVTADGQRFVVGMPASEGATAAPITIVLNWQAMAK